LLDFDGTILLVSHDREFLDNVVTSTLVFEGEGRVAEYVGGYTDWLRQRARATAAGKAASTTNVSSSTAAPSITSPLPVAASTTEAPRKVAKLSYKLQRELDGLPARIEELEKELGAINARIEAADFYQQSKTATSAVLAELASKQLEHDTCFERWLELSGEN
jgi:ABC transport system ATP-binding/permease protein